jgi:hypothetical protein
VKDENPFRPWLERDRYGGYWVPIGQLGAFLGPAACPALVRAESKDVALATTEWPLQLDAATPDVWQVWGDGEVRRESHLHPVEDKGDATYVPLVALFNPFAEPSWLEPIQAFVLYWRAWPRHDNAGNISWFEEDDDSRPDEIARWRLESFERRLTVGTLEVRRDRLMPFLAAFEYDLAVYHEENIEANELEDGWEDEGREENRYWQSWATLVHPEVRALLRAVTFIERPPYEEADVPENRERLEFVVGVDADGNEVMASHPPQEFLTPVFFREEVLERYYEDAHTYVVEQDMVRGGRTRSGASVSPLPRSPSRPAGRTTPRSRNGTSRSAASSAAPTASRRRGRRRPSAATPGRPTTTATTAPATGPTTWMSSSQPRWPARPQSPRSHSPAVDISLGKQ